MGTSTYTPLANLTLGSSAASVTFSSISGAYRDLVLVLSGTTSDANPSINMRLNGDSSSAYPYVRMTGNGSSAASFSDSSQTWANIAPYAGWRSTTIANTIVNIMDYTATDKHKAILSRNNLSDSGVEAEAIRWPSTSTVTTILVYPSSGNFAAGSTFALYGIAS